MRSTLLWLPLAVLYAAFFVWYEGFRAPLTAEEVDRVVERLSAQGLSERDREGVRAFFENDDGGEFVMVNAIELREEPLRVGGVGPEESASDVLGRYMQYMWPELLKRACHPVFGGAAIGPALDAWGVDASRRWTQAGMMRYRSRRDLLEIGGNAAFRDAHVFKEAAMARTVAFPVAPLYVPFGPRVAVGLTLFAIGALAQLLLLAARLRMRR